MAERIDPIMKSLGKDFGRHQLITCVLVYFCKFPCGWGQFSHIFLSAKQDSYCIESENITDPCSEDCKKVEYNRKTFETTIISDFNLICSRSEYGTIAQNVLMIGIMCGGMLFGAMADKKGRKKSFCIACVIQFVFGILVSFSINFWMFIFLRFIYGFATGGQLVVSFIIILEIVGPKYREPICVLYHTPFFLSQSTLPIFSYYIPNWRWYHLAFSAFNIVYILYFFFLYESPRWLLSTGELEKAIKILEKCAKINGAPVKAVRGELDAAGKRMSTYSTLEKRNALDMFKRGKLCFRTILISFDWMALCMTYIGISVILSKLSDDLYMNTLIFSMLGLPGVLLCIPLTRNWGRKNTMILSSFFQGILVLFPILPAYAFAPVAVFSYFGASLTVPNSYLYASELFPTVVRGSGLGFCALMCRLGNLSAPIIIGKFRTNTVWMPSFVCGCVSVCAGFCTYLLPETVGKPLPETLEDNVE